MKNLRKTLLAAALLTAVGTASAEGFVVFAGGNFTTNTNVGQVNARADGRNSRADINVAGVQGSALIDYSSTVNAGRIDTSATGETASARANLGGLQGFTQ
jgi:hypothetical protein